MSLHFKAAPWPTSLKLLSLFGTVLLLGVGYAAYRAIPVPSGFTHQFGLAVAAIPPLILLATLLFVVRGYTLDGETLIVPRLLTRTRIPLHGLQSAWVEAAVCRGSVRVCGNGGLFSFTGWFYSKRLGRYRLLATDLADTVVLRFADRVVVISPATPHAFVDALRQHFPELGTAPEISG